MYHVSIRTPTGGPVCSIFTANPDDPRGLKVHTITADLFDERNLRHFEYVPED